MNFYISRINRSFWVVQLPSDSLYTSKSENNYSMQNTQCHNLLRSDTYSKHYKDGKINGNWYEREDILLNDRELIKLEGTAVIVVVDGASETKRKSQMKPSHAQTHQWHQHARRSCHGCEHSAMFFVSGVGFEGGQIPSPVSQNPSASPERGCPHLHHHWGSRPCCYAGFAEPPAHGHIQAGMAHKILTELGDGHTHTYTLKWDFILLTHSMPITGSAQTRGPSQCHWWLMISYPVIITFSPTDVTSMSQNLQTWGINICMSFLHASMK